MMTPHQLMAGRCQSGIGVPPVSRADLFRELPIFMETVYKKRLLGWYNATKFNMGGTGFFHQFYIWMLVRALKPKHIIESGAYNGLGTWVLRQAAPEAQIIVVSPQTPHLYIDQREHSRYFTAEHFRDFATIDWSCVHGLDRSKTLVFIDDHQSGYRRMLEAHARGFRHHMYDDNEMPATSDHFSVKGACAASNNSLVGPIAWDDFRGIVHDWGRWKRGLFNVSAAQLRHVGRSFARAIDVYAEMPPIWMVGRHRPDAAPPILSADAANTFQTTYKDNLRSARAETIAYNYFLYVHTKSHGEAPPSELYYPQHVTTNGYKGILPVETGSCKGNSPGGAKPSELKQTRQNDDFKRNYGAGARTILSPSIERRARKA